jgi:hypothetical protein
VDARFKDQRTAGMVGLFLAPIAPAVLIGAVEPPSEFLLGLVFAAIFYVVCLAIVSVVGLAVLFALASLGIMRWWVILFCASICGALVPLIIARQFQPFAEGLYSLGAVLAAAVFLIFWYRGPDPSGAEARKWALSFTRFG